MQYILNPTEILFHLSPLAQDRIFGFKGHDQIFGPSDSPEASSPTRKWPLGPFPLVPRGLGLGLEMEEGGALNLW